MTNGNAKGKKGEQDAAKLIREITGWDVKRRVRQHAGDSDLEGVPGWSVEIKRHKTATRAEIARWWAQTVAQAGAKLEPVLIFRRDHDEWRALWKLDIWPTYDMTIEGSIEAWAYVARQSA